jgi:outer membrane lipoprotein-sorting protein
MTVFPIVFLLGGLQSTNIDHYFQPNLHDAAFTTRVLKANQEELKKVNNDFGQLYRFDTIKVQVKEPFRVRFDASVEDTNVLYLVNGTTQLIRIPRMGVHSRTDLAQRPGRRQTIFDFGLLTPSLFQSYLQAKFVRIDRATGDPVFDVTYQDREDTSRSRIWVDPTKDIIAKREWYNQSGRQLATFYYLKPVEVDGIWMPTRVEVKNVDDQIAGITQYTNIKVNDGVSSDRFDIK